MELHAQLPAHICRPLLSVFVSVFRGQDIKKKHEQRVYEREMQRITLPLSAFSNPTCELMDETSIVVTVEPDARDGGEPLIGQQAGTPGA